MIAPIVPTIGKKIQAAKFKPTVGHEAPSRYRAKKGKKSAIHQEKLTGNEKNDNSKNANKNNYTVPFCHLIFVIAFGAACEGADFYHG